MYLFFIGTGRCGVCGLVMFECILEIGPIEQSYELTNAAMDISSDIRISSECRRCYAARVTSRVTIACQVFDPIDSSHSRSNSRTLASFPCLHSSSFINTRHKFNLHPQLPSRSRQPNPSTPMYRRKPKPKSKDAEFPADLKALG